MVVPFGHSGPVTVKLIFALSSSVSLSVLPAKVFVTVRPPLFLVFVNAACVAALPVLSALIVPSTIPVLGVVV